MSVSARSLINPAQTDIVPVAPRAAPKPSASERILATHGAFSTAALLNEANAKQSAKQSILRAASVEAATEGTDMTRGDIDAIGKLVRSLYPSGGRTNAPQVPVPNPSGLLSQVRGRPAQAIDTFENYRLSQQMRTIRQEFIKNKLDAENKMTLDDRADWSAEKMEEKVAQQTLRLV